MAVETSVGTVAIQKRSNAAGAQIATGGVAVVVSPDLEGPANVKLVVYASEPPAPKKRAKETLAVATTAVEFTLDREVRDLPPESPMVLLLPYDQDRQRAGGGAEGAERLACAWWDPLDEDWSFDGCETHLRAAELECRCTHLTLFAGLVRGAELTFTSRGFLRLTFSCLPVRGPGGQRIAAIFVVVAPGSRCCGVGGRGQEVAGPQCLFELLGIVQNYIGLLDFNKIDNSTSSGGFVG